MENIVVIDHDLTTEDKMDLSQNIDVLKSIAQWTKFLSLVGFTWIGLCLVISFTLGSTSKIMTTAYPLLFLCILYLVISLILFFPVVYLFKFSELLKKALKTGRSEDFTDAFFHLKAHYKYVGILTIVLAVLCSISMLGFIMTYLF